MKSFLVVLQCVFVVTNLQSVWAQTTRTHLFRIKSSIVKLGETLPLHTQWPEDKANLPDRISAAVVATNNHENEATLVGPPIHVVVGDILNVTLQNEISEGVSLHFHGFTYSNAFEYAGAVGVSQCPLAKGESFAYNVAVNEVPGTYWYHTEADAAGNLLNEYDAIKGALVVHPKGSEALVDGLNALQSDYNPFAYDNERILFFQDGFISSPATRYLQHVGNLLPPASKSDEGFVVATSQWNFGTCNGKLRDIVNVKPNQKYKFRLINGGEHFALRFSIGDGRFPLTVVAADSNPIEQPYTVDSVVLHVGERFDVEVSIPDLAESESFWIAADTLESQLQGYRNGIKAIMRVSNDETLSNDDVLDPPTSDVVTKDSKVLNCYHADNCIPVTALSTEAESRLEFKSEGDEGTASEIHLVETHFQSAPLSAHFVRVDNSYWIQNELPAAAMISRGFRPSNSVHPHSVPLEVASNSTVIIVWRTTLLMDHPVHLHGHTAEILDVSYPKRKDCKLAYCELNQDYSTSDIRALDRKTRVDTAVKKDTFIIPAGGVVVTRLRTATKGLWLAHGQMDVHRHDGMSFVVNVGNYQIPKLDEWLPREFPSCNTNLVKSLEMNPACECFLDLFGASEKHLCSRPHLCHHELSQSANLLSYPYKKGFSIQKGVVRDWQMPGFIFVLSLGSIVAVSLILLAFLPFNPTSQSKLKDGRTNPWMKRISFLSTTADATTTTRSSVPRRSTIDYTVPHRRSSIDFSVGSVFEGMSYIGTINDADESESDGAHSSRDEETSEHDGNATRNHSMQKSTSRRRLSSIAASIESRLDRALGSILIERGDEGDGTDGFAQEFEIMPDGYSVRGKLTFDPCDSEIVNSNSSYAKQVAYIFRQQFRIYFSSSCNLLRLLEVGGLALLTGQIFRRDFREASEATIHELLSLVLFISISWTFTRMYSILPLQHQWFKSIQIVHKNRRFSLPPVLFARSMVVLLCEFLWPAAFCVICFPVMGLSDWITIWKISLLMCLNNICYLSLGTACALVSSMSYGMILATIMSQLSILISGAFAVLPVSRHLGRQSPFFWTIRGLMKCIFVNSDNYICPHGSSEIEGGSQCFIEESLAIDQFKRRGIYDPSSGTGVFEECIALLILAVCINVFIAIRCTFAFYRVDWYKLRRIK